MPSHRRNSALPGAAAVALLLLPPAARAGLLVPGFSDPWLAGMPDGSLASSVDTAPGQSPALAPLPLLSGSWLLFSAAGLAANGPLQPLFGPDGGYSIYPESTSPVVHIAGAENGISSIWTPISSLLGVFLSDSRPDLSPAPPDLSFGTSAERDYLTLQPGLRQVFFIGDGLTSGGLQQRVAVPDGATRLFLGTMDGFEWGNNLGAFDVTILVETPEPAQTGGVACVLLLAVLAARLRPSRRGCVSARIPSPRAALRTWTSRRCPCSPGL